MEAQKQIQVLRHHLLDMSKLTHRAVDYAIKGYRLGSPEFCRFVRRGNGELGELRRRISVLCKKILMKEIAADSEELMDEMVTDPDIRFTMMALRVCESLHAICTAATEIAHHTMILLEEARQPVCDALEKLCHLANRLTSLSIIALVKKENQHAETILQNRDTVARLAGAAWHHFSHGANRNTIPTALQLGITNSLNQIARQSQEIAEATMFWLEGRRCALESGAIVLL